MARDLATTITALRDAEEARTALQRRIDEELTPTIERLTREKADEGTRADGAERSNREKDQQIAEAQASVASIRQEIDGKDGEIMELGRQIKALQAEIAEFPDTKARREAEAARITRETEETARKAAAAAEAISVRNQQFTAAGLTGLASVLVFGILFLIVGEMDLTLAGGLTVIFVVGAFFAPQLMNLIDRVRPKATQHWRTISVAVSLVVGGTIATLGAVEEHSNLVKVVLWTVETLGFGVLFQGFFESMRILVTKETIEHHDQKKKMAFGYIYCFISGLLAATIYSFIGTSSGAASFLLNSMIGMAGMLGVGLIGVLLGWVGTYVAGSLSGLFPRMQKKHSGVDLWLRRCKAVALIIAVVVGWIVGSGFAHGLTGISNWVVAGVAWFGVSTVFFLIEGKVLEACFLRTYRWYVLVGLLLGATVFATGTAFLSFGKVYHVASQGPRFAEAQQQLVNAQNAYFAATESTCTEFSTDNDGDDQLYTEAINLMKQGVEQAQQAKTYEELATAASTFQQGGAKARECANRKDRKLLESVVVFPEPTPSDLSTQYWFDTKIEGVRVHEGSAKQAIVLVSVIDFLIAILSLFGWIFSSKKRQNGEMGAGMGRIVSIVPDGDGHATQWIVNLGEQFGLEVNDTLNILNDKDEPVGSLVAQEPLGNGAFICVAAGKMPEVELGSMVRMVN